MAIRLADKKLQIGYFLYEIVHHCNLECKGCDHCAPIAQEEYVELKTYKKDIAKMQKIFHRINSFAIMGGEPLLHPQIIDIMKISREILKYTHISIYTNGIELEKQPPLFWEACKKYKIYIFVTKYKININRAKILEMAQKYNVIIGYERNSVKNFFHKIKFNLEGNENINVVHNSCFHATLCHQLENGILYKCPIVPAARHFNSFFNKNMKISENDGLNIHKKLKQEEIKEYFEKPIPFCKYCNMSEREENKEWGISKKEITEWT